MQFSTAFFAMTLALGVSALEPSVDGVVYWCYQGDGVKFTAVDLCTSRGMQSLEGRSGVSSDNTPHCKNRNSKVALDLCRTAVSLTRPCPSKSPTVTAAPTSCLMPARASVERTSSAPTTSLASWCKKTSTKLRSKQRSFWIDSFVQTWDMDVSMGSVIVKGTSVYNLIGLGMRLALGFDLGEKG